MKRNAAILFIVALTVSAMIYTAAKRTKTGGPNATSGSASVDGVKLVSTDAKGHLAPDFSLQTLDGKTVKLSGLRGKAVLINFWATWCGPCKIETPWLVDLKNKFGPQGLEIVGLAVESEKDDIAKFVKEEGINYTIVVGNQSVKDVFDVQDGLPTTFFIGRDGRVVDFSLGLVDKSEIENNIKKSLAQGSASDHAAIRPTAATTLMASASNSVQLKK